MCMYVACVCVHVCDKEVPGGLRGPMAAHVHVCGMCVCMYVTKWYLGAREGGLLQCRKAIAHKCVKNLEDGETDRPVTLFHCVCLIV
jgi:hypothetical protein